jgi:DNA-binding SARP family transcriptional activator
MAEGTEFGLLGPLLVRCSGTLVPVPPGKQRAVLAVLLLHAGRVVPVDEIAEVLWGPVPPPSARVTVRNYVKRLRLTLGDPGRERISTQPRGYLIRVAAAELDVARFEALISAARTAARGGAWAVSAARARAALSLWRGDPLADVQSGALAALEIPRLAELRLQALEFRLEADLHLGRQSDVIAELRQLAGIYPLREHLQALLMLAYYQSGRQAEALAAYRHAREVLVEGLGVEPGAELRELHQQILRGNPALAQPGGSELSMAAEPAASLVPHQLPARGPRFIGRMAELATLLKLLDQTALVPGRPGTSGAPTIVAISGTAGVGKTALALHFAHQVADDFPDGQLYLNLRGFDPSGQPLHPAAAVRSLLDALGVCAEQLPVGPDAQAGLYRSLLAGRGMLIVLDNAADTGQVRPLLPGDGGCLIVVTSRRQLTALGVLDGAHALTLDLLTDSDARDLLASRLGEARLASDPVATAELVVQCARLPLALSVAAARAQAQPGLPLAVLASDLREVRGRLDALDGGEEIIDVRAVFSWSYQQLPPAAARMFALLGLHPGPDITVAAAASLAGVSGADAGRVLGQLTRACLLSEHVPGRFAFHDLLRAYAAEQAAAEDDARRQDAIRRLAGHYLHSAAAADRAIYATRPPVALPAPPPGTQPETFPGYARALGWFDQEHYVLLAVIDLAAAAGLHACAWQLPWTLETFLFRRAHWHDWAATQATALAAARHLADPDAQAHAHRGIANARIESGFFDQGHRHLAQALQLCENAGDLLGQARIHLDLARSAGYQHHYDDYLIHARRGLELSRAAGDPAGEGNGLAEVAWALALNGRHEQAIAYGHDALRLVRNCGNRAQEGHIWDTIGYAHHHLGHHAEAAACYQQAVQILDEVGFHFGKAVTLTFAGEAYRAAGDLPAARDAWRAAHLILRDVDHPARAKLLANLRELDAAEAGVHHA